MGQLDGGLGGDERGVRRGGGVGVYVVLVDVGQPRAGQGLVVRVDDRGQADVAALRHQQLSGHVKTGLRIGMTREQIVEVFVHLAPYIGVPKALAGLRVAADAIADSGQEGMR
ncbi:carboxymuconolactone decarboxylase family protein [Streptomyces olivaceus]|nr:carboxymuconolactone decarboxylase family protein [Streptomyces olivaceus]